MAYKITDQRAGYQAVATIETTAKHPLGTEVDIDDPTYGYGRAVYVAFPISTAVAANLLCVWDSAFTSAILANTSTTHQNTGRPLGLNLTAVASVAALQYGWLLIVGSNPTLKTATQITSLSKFYVSGTAGRVMPTSAVGLQILGVRGPQALVTTTTSLVTIYYSRPHLMSQHLLA